ncbi:MAG: hypothetical protein AB7F59_08345 [Bdellovibrionales bacterium]
MKRHGKQVYAIGLSAILLLLVLTQFQNCGAPNGESAFGTDSSSSSSCDNYGCIDDDELGTGGGSGYGSGSDSGSGSGTGTSTGGSSGSGTDGNTGGGTGVSGPNCPVTVVATATLGNISVDGDTVCAPWVFSSCLSNGGYVRIRTCPTSYGCRTSDANGPGTPLNIRTTAMENITCEFRNGQWVKR